MTITLGEQSPPNPQQVPFAGRGKNKRFHKKNSVTVPLHVFNQDPGAVFKKAQAKALAAGQQAPAASNKRPFDTRPANTETDTQPIAQATGDTIAISEQQDSNTPTASEQNSSKPAESGLPSRLISGLAAPFKFVYNCITGFASWLASFFRGDK